MVTKPVTIKAMVRVCADLARADADPAEGRVKRWEERLAPWTEQQREFRSEGFYERFPAKGQIERVARIHRDLARWADIEVRRARKDARLVALTRPAPLGVDEQREPRFRSVTSRLELTAIIAP